MKRVKFFLQALSSFPSRILAFSRKPLGRSLPKAKANSIKFQISILYTSILGVILIVFSGVLYIILSHSLYVEPDYKLKQKAQEISQYLDIRGGVPGALEFAATKTIAPETVKLSRWWMGGFERRWFKRLDKLDLRRDFINFASFDEVSIIHSKTLTDDMLELFEAHIRFPSDGESILKSITYNKKKLIRPVFGSTPSGIRYKVAVSSEKNIAKYKASDCDLIRMKNRLSIDNPVIDKNLTGHQLCMKI